MTQLEAFLYDLGFEIKQRAREAAAQARRERGNGGEFSQFDDGRAMAYGEVISLMQQSAAGFGIPLSMLRLDDIDPDRDLA